MAELKAGMRRFGDTELGGQYQRVMAHHGEGDASIPPVATRTLGDVLDPYRAAEPTGIVNAVSQSVSMDAAAWSWHRLLNYYGQLEQDSRQRERQAED